jgi:DNA-3-methyladenine glycosylase
VELEPFVEQTLWSDSPVVAPMLLGALIQNASTGLLIRIIETEAYMPDDPASHSFRRLTERNRAMFEAAGCWYVYFVYGMHWCLNVVTGPADSGQAVLIRAGVVESDKGRPSSSGRTVDGPAKLARALGVDKRIDQTSCFGEGPLQLMSDGTRLPVHSVTSRVRISVGKDKEWRFCAEGAPVRRVS